MKAFVLIGELLFADLFFDLIKRCDSLESRLNTFRLVRMRFNEFAATMALILRTR